MTAAGNGRAYRLASTQLAITGLVTVVSGALIGALSGCHQPPAATSSAAAPVKVLPAPGGGMDTPIVISGGSIHFKAKQSDWVSCDGSSTTCYKATFTDKQTTKNYQVFNDYDLNAVPVASVTNGWEIDVVDTNPDTKTQHMVRVCAESTDYANCNLGAFSSTFIYVIAVGGTFELPDKTATSNGPRILYDDSAKPKYDKINDIRLNASAPGVGGTDNPCTNNACAVFLSQ